MERETGFEPATPSLEGWRSTAELFPRIAATRTLRRPPSDLAGQAALATIAATRTSRRPPTVLAWHAAPATMVGRGGFEPPKAFASRFTVCPLWPLGYLPEPAGM